MRQDDGLIRTTVLQADPSRPERDRIEQAARVIRRGGLVAFPTETVYGLGADALSEAAVAGIFRAKGRPPDNPLIVHVSGIDMLGVATRQIDPRAGTLIERFWPGPLTLVLPKGPRLAKSVCAGLDTVAVRMPRSAVALALIERTGTPIAAPSANASGRPSPTSAAHVLQDLNGRIDLVLDSGPTAIGIESTVLDLTSPVPTILRPGWITREALSELIGEVNIAASGDQTKKSPGTRYRHYSPRARVVLIEGGSADFIRELCERRLEEGGVGFLGHTPTGLKRRGFTELNIGSEAGEYASSIYSGLRELDALGPLIIVVEGIDPIGAGAAVMDRLRRAASEVMSQTEDA